MKIYILPALSGPDHVLHIQVSAYTFSFPHASKLTCENAKKQAIEEIQQFLSEERAKRQTRATKLLALCDYRRKRKINRMSA